MSLAYHQQRFAHDVANLILYIYLKNYSCTLGEAYRTPEQAAIYAKEGKGIINSQHCKKLGIDLNLFTPAGDYTIKEEDYRPFAEYWKSLDPLNRAGIDFKRVDSGHFERNA